MPAKRPDKAYIQTKIRDLYRNRTAEEIVEILRLDPNVVSNVTLASVRNDIFRMRSHHGLLHKDRPWSREDELNLQGMYELGAAIPDIAQRLNRTIPAIHARISQSGLANRKISEHQEEAVRILLTTTDQSLTGIAVTLGLKYESVRHVWEGMKASGRVEGRRRPPGLHGGSMAEKLLRGHFTDMYGHAVIWPPNNRSWCKQHYEIDIPIDFGDGRKFAVEVNHVRTHAYRRNIDYRKRSLAQSLGWLWITLWINDSFQDNGLTSRFQRCAGSLRNANRAWRLITTSMCNKSLN